MVLLQQPPAAPPELSIMLSGANVVVSWPASTTGFVLQQTSDLTQPTWTTFGITPLSANNQTQVILPVTDNMFFRLAPQ